VSTSELRPKTIRPDLPSIYFVVESPLSERDTLRFGLRTLRDSGFQVHVWDVSHLYLPKSNMQFISEPTDFTAIGFQELNSFFAACRNLCQGDVVITLSGVYRGQLSTHRRLLAAISKSPALFCSVSATHIPDFKNPDLKMKSVTTILLRFKILVHRCLLSSSWNRAMYRSWIRIRYGIRPLDAIWAGTTTFPIDDALISKRTAVRFIHSFDYDLIAPEFPNVNSTQGGAVLLDTMGPLHPDFETLNESLQGQNAAYYFRALRTWLDRAEAEIGAKLTIAAHPRAAPGTLEEHYGHRRILYGKTASAVARSQLVILTSATTSAGMAVAMSKPIVGIRIPGAGYSIHSQLEELAGILKFRLLHADESLAPLVAAEISETAYSAYMSNYVKHDGTPDRPFWENVAEDLMHIEDCLKELPARAEKYKDASPPNSVQQARP